MQRPLDPTGLDSVALQVLLVMQSLPLLLVSLMVTVATHALVSSMTKRNKTMTCAVMEKWSNECGFMEKLTVRKLEQCDFLALPQLTDPQIPTLKQSSISLSKE